MFAPGRCARRSSSLSTPACGWKTSFHMIPTITGGIAHGHERERAGEPAAVQRLAEQQRQPEREDRTGWPSPRPPRSGRS